MSLQLVQNNCRVSFLLFFCKKETEKDIYKKIFCPAELFLKGSGKGMVYWLWEQGRCIVIEQKIKDGEELVPNNPKVLCIRINISAGLYNLLSA